MELPEDTYRSLLAFRRDEILGRAEAALARSGRSAGAARLVAVSKTVGIAELLCAIQVGYRDFAENRPQELVRKQTGLLDAAALGTEVPPVAFDMIGNLQTNKINAVLGRVNLIHSISSLHLAQAVSARAQRQIEAGALTVPQQVLLEVNVSGEATKSGFSPVEVQKAMDELVELSGIHIRGFMTMAPRGNKDVARKTFSGLRELRDMMQERYPEQTLSELSCGMSEDFEVALEEGSTIIRLGRVVFDPDFALQ